MRTTIYILLATLIFSCTEEKSINKQGQSYNIQSSDSIISSNAIYSDSCKNDVVLFDSIFNGIQVTLIDNCINNSTIQDTAVDSENHKNIYIYHNSELKVKFLIGNKTLEHSFTKEKYLNKEYDVVTLKKSVFGNIDFENYNQNDSTIYFNVFFGFPDSDFGEYLKLKASPTNGIKLLEIISSEL